MAEGYCPVEQPGKARTDLHCHNCSKGFIAELDFSIEGNHKIICPRCGHIHYRLIQQGKITEERWWSGYETIEVSPQCTWTPSVIKQECSVAAQFLRDSWLNRSDWS